MKPRYSSSAAVFADMLEDEDIKHPRPTLQSATLTTIEGARSEYSLLNNGDGQAADQMDILDGDELSQSQSQQVDSTHTTSPLDYAAACVNLSYDALQNHGKQLSARWDSEPAHGYQAQAIVIESDDERSFTPDQARLQDTPLTELDEEARQQYYNHVYADKAVHFKHMSLPKICAQYPDFKDEILAAYMQNTTFTCKVWMNYDTVEKKFFDDHDRIRHCGKLRMPPSTRSQLEKWETTYKLGIVILEICTAFNTLGWITITTTRQQLFMKFLPSERYKYHTTLVQFLQGKVENLKYDINSAGIHVLNTDFLDATAQACVCRVQDYAHSLEDLPTMFIQRVQDFRECTQPHRASDNEVWVEAVAEADEAPGIDLQMTDAGLSPAWSFDTMQMWPPYSF